MNKPTTTAQEAASPETGEVQKIRYYEGAPRNYRFNGSTGKFNIDDEIQLGANFSFQPLAWRVFDDSLFGRNRPERWAEVYFVDEAGNLSMIMFSSSSANELMSLVPKLFYSGEKKLSDVVLTVTSEKKTNDKGNWHLAKFAAEDAPAEAVAMLAEFAAQHPIYRADTITPHAVYCDVSDAYAIDKAHKIAAELRQQNAKSSALQLTQAA